MVRVLLDYKADVNARGFDNWAPLHMVSQGVQFFGILRHNPQMLADVARLLLEHGADVTALTDDGETPLHIAAEWNAVEVVRVLLEHSADVGAKDNTGSTPLHNTVGHRYAGGHRRVEIVRVLLEHGANVGAEDNEGRTPFQIASADGENEIIELLSEKGAKDVS